jgi:hypothetical protein
MFIAVRMSREPQAEQLGRGPDGESVDRRVRALSGACATAAKAQTASTLFRRAKLTAPSAGDAVPRVGAAGLTTFGCDLGEAIGAARLGVMVSASLAEALAAPADVLIANLIPPHFTGSIASA